MSTVKATNFQHASAASPAIVLAADGTAAASVSSINGGALAGLRNRIMNGAMTLAQRGVSFPAITSGTYTLDRWLWNNIGSMVCTVSESSDVPNDTFINSLKVDVTTADASLAAGEYATILQPIEGVNVRDLIGTTFTLSFWVKSPKAGVHCVSFRNERTPLPDRSYVKEYTVVTANTWEYKTVTVVGGLITAGTWNWTNGLGLDVLFVLSAGTTWHTTADAWQIGNFLSTANQVNVMDNTANDFFITGVQLEPGTVATPFERRPQGLERVLCERYYEFGIAHFGGYATGGTGVYYSVQWKVTKRVAPSLTYAPLQNTNVSTYDIRTPSTGSAIWFAITAATGGFAWSGDWTASAEL